MGFLIVLSWQREGEPLETKYLYVVHSEMNAILTEIEVS